METALMLSNLSVIQSIDEITVGISDEVINRVGSKMEPVGNGEIPFGTIQNPIAKRLYCAFPYLSAKASSHAAESAWAISDAEEIMLADKSNRCRKLLDVIKTLFWVQIATEMGCWSENIGIRRNWMLVVIEGGNRHPILSALLGNSADPE